METLLNDSHDPKMSGDYDLDDAMPTKFDFRTTFENMQPAPLHEYDWAVLPNHLHLAIRQVPRPRAKSSKSSDNVNPMAGGQIRQNEVSTHSTCYLGMGITLQTRGVITGGLPVAATGRQTYRQVWAALVKALTTVDEDRAARGYSAPKFADEKEAVAFIRRKAREEVAKHKKNKAEGSAGGLKAGDTNSGESCSTHRSSTSSSSSSNTTGSSSPRRVTRPTRITVTDPEFASWLREEGLTAKAQRDTKVEVVSDETVVSGFQSPTGHVEPPATVGEVVSECFEGVAGTPGPSALNGLSSTSSANDGNYANTATDSNTNVIASGSAEKENQRPGSDNPADGELKCPAFVVVRGLKSAAGQRLNGQSARVIEHVPDTGRYATEFPNGVSKLLKNENLWVPKFALGHRVKLVFGESSKRNTSEGEAAASAEDIVSLVTETAFISQLDRGELEVLEDESDQKENHSVPDAAQPPRDLSYLRNTVGMVLRYDVSDPQRPAYLVEVVLPETYDLTKPTQLQPRSAKEQETNAAARARHFVKIPEAGGLLGTPAAYTKEQFGGAPTFAQEFTQMMDFFPAAEQVFSPKSPTPEILVRDVNCRTGEVIQWQRTVYPEYDVSTTRDLTRVQVMAVKRNRERPFPKEPESPENMSPCDLFTEKQKVAQLIPRVRDWEFGIHVQNFMRLHERTRPESFGDREGKNAAFNSIRALLQSDELQMTRAKMQQLISVFDLPARDRQMPARFFATPAFGSPTVQVMMDPWIGSAGEIYDLLSKRDDVEGRDLDAFHDRCVAEQRKQTAWEGCSRQTADGDSALGPEDWVYTTARTYHIRCGTLYLRPTSSRGEMGPDSQEPIGTMEELSATAKNCLALFPNSPDAHGMMACSLLLRGECVQALDWFHRGLLLAEAEEPHLRSADHAPESNTNNNPYLRHLFGKAVALRRVATSTEDILAAIKVGKRLASINPADKYGITLLLAQWAAEVGDVRYTRGVFAHPDLSLDFMRDRIGGEALLYLRFWLAVHEAVDAGTFPTELTLGEAWDRNCSKHLCNAMSVQPWIAKFLTDGEADCEMEKPFPLLRTYDFVSKENARLYVSECYKFLWKDRLPRALEWLRQKRDSHVNNWPTQSELRSALKKASLLITFRDDRTESSCTGASSSSSSSNASSPCVTTVTKEVFCTSRLGLIPHNARAGARDSQQLPEVEDGAMLCVYDHTTQEWITFSYESIQEVPFFDVLKTQKQPNLVVSGARLNVTNNLNSDGEASGRPALESVQRIRDVRSADRQTRERELYESEMLSSGFRAVREAKLRHRNVLKVIDLRNQRLRAQSAESGDGGVKLMISSAESAAADIPSRFVLTEFPHAIGTIEWELLVLRVLEYELASLPDAVANIQCHNQQLREMLERDGGLVTACKEFLERVEVTKEDVVKDREWILSLLETLTASEKQQIDDKLRMSGFLESSREHGGSDSLVQNIVDKYVACADGEKTEGPPAAAAATSAAVTVTDKATKGTNAEAAVQTPPSGAQSEKSQNTKPKKNTMRECPFCNEQIPKESLKRHKEKKCGKRLVRCPQSCSKKYVTAEALGFHVQHECEERRVVCTLCSQMDIPARMLEKHLQNRCPMRTVKCSRVVREGNEARGCTWEGPWQESAAHERVCPFLPTECPTCYEQFPQYKMASHRCRIIGNDIACCVCTEPYSSLLESSLNKQGSTADNTPVLPAILVCGASRLCTCKHPPMCTRCAPNWLQINGTCPVCRSPYDGALPVPEYLVAPADDKVNESDAGRTGRSGSITSLQFCSAPPPLLLPPQDAPPGSTFWVSPLDIRFTHDSVKMSFRDFYDRSRRCKIQDQSILASLREVLEEDEKRKQIPRALDCLDVCWAPHDAGKNSKNFNGNNSTKSSSGKEAEETEDNGMGLYLAGTGNRRLTMWRLLAIFREHNWGCIKVRVVGWEDPGVKFREKCTTVCKGKWIAVRRGGDKRGLRNLNVSGKPNAKEAWVAKKDGETGTVAGDEEEAQSSVNKAGGANQHANQNEPSGDNNFQMILVGRQRLPDVGRMDDREGTDPGVQWPEAISLFQRTEYEQRVHNST